MKMNEVFPKLKMKWHTLRVHYHLALLEGCLDSRLKKKLQCKLRYHERKVDNLVKFR